MRVEETRASIGQRLLWLLDQYSGSGGALNCPMLCRVEGPLDFAMLESTVTALVARHESLRTTFFRKDRQLRQMIHSPRPAAILRRDLSGRDDPESAARAAIAEELRSEINPANWPMRSTLWRLSERTHILCVNLHHLVTDTWSCMVLQRELASLYQQCASGIAPSPPACWQFRQFMAWQEQQIKSNGLCRQREYWQRQLEGAEAPRLPSGGAGLNGLSQRRSVDTEMDGPCVDALMSVAAEHRTTLFAVMLSVCYVLLNLITRQKDLAVATVFANRCRPEVEYTVGFLANLVVLRTRIEMAASFAVVVDRVRTTVVDGLAYQDLPYHLVSKSTGGRGVARLDELTFQMLVQPIDETIQAGPVQFRGVVPDVVGRFDFELALMPRHRSMAAKFYYTEKKASTRWARDFICAYTALSAILAASPHSPLERLVGSIALPSTS